MPYKKLDLILQALEKGWEAADIDRVLQTNENDIRYVQKLILKPEHMRKPYNA